MVLGQQHTRSLSSAWDAFCERSRSYPYNGTGNADYLGVWDADDADFHACFSQFAFTFLPHFFGLLFMCTVFWCCGRHTVNRRQSTRPFSPTLILSVLTGLSATTLLAGKSSLTAPANSEFWAYGTAACCWLLVAGTLFFKRGEQRVHLFVDGFSAVVVLCGTVGLRTATWKFLEHAGGRDNFVFLQLFSNALFFVFALLSSLSRCWCCPCTSANRAWKRHEFKHASDYRELSGRPNGMIVNSRQTYATNAVAAPGKDDYVGEEDAAGLFQKFYFCWISGVLSTGYRQKKLDMSDLPKSAQCDDPSALYRTFLRIWHEEVFLTNNKPSLARVLHRQLGVRFWMSGLLLAISLVGTLSVPSLTHAILEYLETRTAAREEILAKGGALEYSVLLVLLLTTMSMVQSIFQHQFWIMGVRVCMHVQIVLQAHVFRKSCRLSHRSRAKTLEGEMSNLLSSDACNIPNSYWVPMFHWGTWCSILTTGVSLYNLYLLLGPAAFGGLAIICILLPCAYCSSRHIKAAYKKMMSFRDARGAMVVEYLRAIRLLKAFASESWAWNDISEHRCQELAWQRRQQFLSISNILIASVGPVMINVVSFALYAALGGDVSASKVFTSLLWLSNLQRGISRLPGSIMSTMSSFASLKRLERFFLLEELPLSTTTPTTKPMTFADAGVHVDKASFAWATAPLKEAGSNGENEQRPSSLAAARSDDGMKTQTAVRNVSFSAVPGELICIVGPVGAGKSTILAGITNNIDCTSGGVKSVGSVAFVGQSPWLRTATIKENICEFGSGDTVNARRLEEVIHACALLPDIRNFPDGVNTVVGSDGVTLSGGQRQRVALARALYSDADIYVLDDILSAVDGIVGRHIFEHAIVSGLKKRGKVVILATHAIDYVRDERVDGVCSISSEGDFLRFGKYDKSMMKMMPVSANRRRAGPADTGEEDHGCGKIEGRTSDSEKQVVQERRQDGYVAWADFLLYCRHFGLWNAFFLLLLFLLNQGLSVGQQYWLTVWINSGDPRNDIFMIVYAGLGLLLSALVSMQSYLVIVGSMQGAKRMHDMAMKGVLLARVTFFDKTPFGRIINRLVSDVANIDSRMAPALVSVMSALLQIMSVIVIVCTTSPFVLLLFVLLAYPYHTCGQYYRWSSRDLRRLQSVSKSPIITLFSEAVRGVPVIRAHRAERSFNERFQKSLGEYASAYYCSWAANQWVTAVLELMGIAVILVSTMAAVSMHLFNDSVNPAIIGLALTYTLQLPGNMMWLIRNLATAETELVAVERVAEYGMLPTEPRDILPRETSPSSPRRPLLVNLTTHTKTGKLEFANVHMRYRPELEPSLKGISITIAAGTKVAVRGRTGAGKSSLLLALMRFYHVDGAIRIDDHDAGAMDLGDMRAAIAYVPQEAHLLSGTLRESIGQFGCSGRPDDVDRMIWKALKMVKMEEVVRGLPDQLDTRISDGGSMFSQGERQLLCLSRALLRRAALLIADEATASVDDDSETMVQNILLRLPVTVLYICHRMAQLDKFDKILTLDNGKIVGYEDSV